MTLKENPSGADTNKLFFIFIFIMVHIIVEYYKTISFTPNSLPIYFNTMHSNSYFSLSSFIHIHAAC